MLTTDGYVSEARARTSSSFETGDHRPPNSAVGALEGITADSVRRSPTDLGYTVREELLRRPDLYLADEAFLTGTAAEVVPMARSTTDEVGAGKPGPGHTGDSAGLLRDGAWRDVTSTSDWLDYVG